MRTQKNFKKGSTGGTPAPNKPEKEIPVKPDENPDPTRAKPGGGNDAKKNDPTRIEEPRKNDPTRIDEPSQKPIQPTRQLLSRRILQYMSLGFRATLRNKHVIEKKIKTVL